MITYKYIIYGEPLIHIQEKEQAAWNHYKQQKVKALISLEGQHDGKPLLEGSVSLEVHFATIETKHEMSCFIRFIENILSTIVYTEPLQLSFIKASRSHVKKDPYTTIIISEIEDK